jgi:hypothetical protein
MIHTNSLPDLNPLLGQTNKNPRIGHDMQVGEKVTDAVGLVFTNLASLYSNGPSTSTFACCTPKVKSDTSTRVKHMPFVLSSVLYQSLLVSKIFYKQWQ